MTDEAILIACYLCATYSFQSFERLQFASMVEILNTCTPWNLNDAEEVKGSF